MAKNKKLKPCKKCSFEKFCKGAILVGGQCPTLFTGYPEKCPICRGVGRLLEKDKWMDCLCSAFKKTRAYLSKLGCDTFYLSAGVVELLKKVERGNNILIKAPNLDWDSLSSIWAYFLLREGIGRSYHVLNTYQLIQILLKEGDITERFSSLYHLNMDVLVVDHGLHKVPNKLYADTILQVLDFRSFHKQVTWIHTKVELTDAMEVVGQYIDRAGWSIINLVTESTQDEDVTVAGSGIVDSNKDRMRGNVNRTLYGENG